MDTESIEGLRDGPELVPRFLPLSPSTEPVNGETKGRSVNPNHGFMVSSPPMPIAICGIALRLPGGIRNGEDFWDLLTNKRDARAPVPPDRYNVQGFSEDLGSKDYIKSQHGYFLEENLSGLDTSFFSMTADELAKCDPQQRQILEVTRECLENAGETNYRGKEIGCYVGTFAEDWLQMNAKDSQHQGQYLMTGHLDFMIANRVSYEYDLHGPSQVYKTGCSASLIALHEACRALQNGDCSAALVAGTNLIMGPTMTIEMTGEGVISPNASCRPFDAGADGFARAEAINMVYIKRLDDAVQDGNPVRAVIRNTATNCAGKGGSLMQPNGLVQEQLMHKVYRGAGLDPSSTAYVECHGTGTPTGDPIETEAVSNVFGTSGVNIGSVKANVGHAEGASGLTSLIKAVLALEHHIIPPNIKFDVPNPKIPFEEKKLKVVTECSTWPKDRAHRISINSFGIGGANAHVIVDARSEFEAGPNKAREAFKTRRMTLIPISANTHNALQGHKIKIQDYCDKRPENILDLAFTLSLHREHMPYRMYTITGSGNCTFSNILKAPAHAPAVVMIFTGQGSQWAGMAAELLAADSEFRKDIQGMDHILQNLKQPPGWTIEDELQKVSEHSNLHRAEIAQPICTALQIALVNALRRWNVRPSAVVGHSSGEIAAAYASGGLSLRAALILAFYRGSATNVQDKPGGMAAIGLGAKEVRDLLPEELVVACENSHNSTTISGNLVALDQFLEKMRTERPDLLARKLKVDMAYHSPQMQPVAVEYLKLIEGELHGEDIGSRSVEAPLYSSVTTKVMKDGRALGFQYWISNLVSPVLFSSAVSEAVLVHGRDVFLEIGPHSTLAGSLRSILSNAGHACTYVPTMLRNKDCERSFLSAIGQLYQLGVDIDFSKVNGSGAVLSNLPTYSWDRNIGRWYEPQLSRDWRFRRYGYHSLLGLRIPGTTDMEPCWRNVLSVEEETWLQDHKVLEEPIFSFGGYCAMALEAVRQISGDETPFSLTNVVASEAMRFTDSKPVEVRTTLQSDSHDDRSSLSGSWRFVISSNSEIGWVTNCEGRLKPRRKHLAPSYPGPQRLFRKVVPSSWYKALANVGFYLGPQYPQFSSIETLGGTNVARGHMCNSHPKTGSTSSPHPSFIDSCLILPTVAMANGLARSIELPMLSSAEEIDIANGEEEMTVAAWSADGGEKYTVEGFADERVVFRFVGVQISQLKGGMKKTYPYAAAQLHWLPHFNLISHSPLFKPPMFNMDILKLREELTLLCAIDSAERIRDLETTEVHYVKYRNWFRKEIFRAQTEQYSVLENDVVNTNLGISSSSRRRIIEELFGRIFCIWPEDAITKTVRLIWERIERLFTGEEQALNVLFQDDLLIKVYDACAFDFSDFIKSMSHMNPSLRILEVGAGTGSTTATFIDSLIVEGQPGYSLYTFTDISNGFFPQAKERFLYAPNMDFQVFDISQDPFKQGFSKCAYDLIIATNVVHATPCLAESLANLRPLLAENGRLVLTELTSVMKIWSYVFGTLPGWWMGEADGRPDQPHVSLDRWDHELRAAGFTGAETIVHDADPPYQYCTVIVSGPNLAAQNLEEHRKLALLCQNPHEGVAKLLFADLTEHGYSCTTCALEDALSDDRTIISVLDLEDALLDDARVDPFDSFQRSLGNYTSQKVLWLTLPCQMSCRDAGSSQSIGLARTIRSRSDIVLYTLEIDPGKPGFGRSVKCVLTEVEASREAGDLLPDKEFVVHDGVAHVGRYHPLSQDEQRPLWPKSNASQVQRHGATPKCAMLKEQTSLPATSDLSTNLNSTSSAGETVSNPDSLPDVVSENTYVSTLRGVDKLMVVDQRSKKLEQVATNEAVNLDSLCGKRKLVLDPEAAYLLTGNLEELETSFISWLVAYGARTILVLHRSADIDSRRRSIVADMRTLGCNLVNVAGEASSLEDVEKAISLVNRPVKGLIGFMNVGKDIPIQEASHEEERMAIEPAAREARSLHKALQKQPLEFFFLTTSLSMILQHQCQENIEIANAFLVAMCQYRHDLGLPASVMTIAGSNGGSQNWTENAVIELMELSLLNLGHQEHAGECLQPDAGRTNRYHILLCPQSAISLQDLHRKGETPICDDRRFGFFRNSIIAKAEHTSSAKTENELSDLLSHARANPSILDTHSKQFLPDAATVIAQAIGASALEFRLRKDEDVDIESSLAQMGMDSLKVIELRKWWRRALGCEVELRELTEEKSLKDLGMAAIERIREALVGVQ